MLIRHRKAVVHEMCSREGYSALVIGLSWNHSLEECWRSVAHSSKTNENNI